MQNFKVFYKSYKTLDSSDAINPKFKIIYHVPMQTEGNPIPKITK